MSGIRMSVMAASNTWVRTTASASVAVFAVDT